MIRLLPFDDFNQSSEAMLPLTRLFNSKVWWPDSRIAPNLKIETLLDNVPDLWESFFNLLGLLHLEIGKCLGFNIVAVK